MFIFCVKAALLAKRAFVACFASWYIVTVSVIVYHVLDKAQLAVVLHTVHWCRKSRCCCWCPAATGYDMDHTWHRWEAARDYADRPPPPPLVHLCLTVECITSGLHLSVF